MVFVRDFFFKEIQPLFGGSFKQVQVDGLEAILTEWERRKPSGDLRWLAYMLATAFHETNQQMQPVREAYWLSEQWRRTNLTYYPYYGRGYVQLTWESNYKRAGLAVNRNLAAHPDDALDLDIAAHVMFVGMEEGWFRSGGGAPYSLGRFFSATTDDPKGARKIINGKEVKKIGGVEVTIASIIAQYHEAFLSALKASEQPGATAAGPAISAASKSVAPVVLSGGGGAAAGYAGRMVAAATAEWEFFGKQTYNVTGGLVQAGHKEAENGWWERIETYWVDGCDKHGIDGRDTGWPWSAAFVSWVAKRAAAGTRFHYSAQHSQFIDQSIRDYLTKRDAGFWGVRLAEAKPDVGDIICWGRQAGVDYDHQMNGDYHGHSDHVVAVEAGQIWIIGGNVGNSVTRRPVALNANGFLEPVVVNGENLFALMKNRLG